MARKTRKTIDIKRLIEIVNSRNEKSTCSAEIRAGWNDLIEQVLMETNNYEGFQYLRYNEVPVGALAGIEPGHDNGRPIIPDSSRRRYIS